MRNRESDDDDPQHYAERYIERIPPARAPPPPPPPRRNVPPPPPPPGALPRPDWILSIRLPRTRHIRKILVSPGSMTEESFSICLQSALEIPASELSSFPIVGLWCEPTRTFLSLHHILSLHDPEQQCMVHTLQLRDDEPKISFWQRYMENPVLFVLHFILLPCCAVALVRIENLLQLIATSTFSAMDLFIETPLTTLHRFGPRYLGFWEGELLEVVCARITYHGDATFWRRNMMDCEHIYNTKLNAFLQVSRPISYLVVCFCIVMAIATALRKPPPPVNHEAIDLYRAFGTIIRQFQVQTNHATRHQQRT